MSCHDFQNLNDKTVRAFTHAHITTPTQALIAGNDSSTKQRAQAYHPGLRHVQHHVKPPASAAGAVPFPNEIHYAQKNGVDDQNGDYSVEQRCWVVVTF